jgi:hypothetical protein
MKKLVMVSALVFGVFGASACGSKADNALNDLEGFKNKMCECKDAACVDSVEKDMEAWEKKMRDSDMKKSDLSDDQKARAKEISKAMRECRRNAKKSDSE